MAFQSVPETAEVDIIFTLNGVTVQNTHYARHPGGYILSDLQALADTIDGAFVTNSQDDSPSEVTYVRTEVRGLEFENDQVASANTNSASGTHGGDALPNQVTFAIKKVSGQTGRSARGRVFWVGIPDSETVAADENFLVQTYVDNIVANIDWIRTLINTTSFWTAVLVSRFTAGAKRDEGVTFPWIDTLAVDNRLDTHRGRLPSV